ncbi:MAG: ABC transporter ATP-binding protein [Hyphococcus sp.]|nr:MAG: ABC transporter ATP-binding protein [Marinicaulis sp.]
MSLALNIKNLSLTIDDTGILKGVNLTLEAGKITGLAGRSGSGKSMTAFAAMGLTPSRSRVKGSILLDGQNLLEKTDQEMCALRGQKIAMVFQEPMTALNPLHTIGAQIAETILIHSDATRDEAHAKAETLMERVGLPLHEIAPTRYPHELSGGQRQRVVIAIAIAMNPNVLIADEPTTALDVTTQAQILSLLRELTEQNNIALLLITHDLAVLSSISDSIAVMRDGCIAGVSETKAFFQQTHADNHFGLLPAPVVKPEKPATLEKTPPPILEASNLVCTYIQNKKSLFSEPEIFRAVDGVSLTIRKGEHVGLAGESGCGKSTLARALLGLHELASGSIKIDGEDFPSTTPAHTKHIRKKIQIVFQDPYGSFNPHQRVEQIIAEPFHLFDQPLSKPEQKERVHDALETVGLEKKAAEQFPHEFSGGQRQRIAIARALITEPEIIVFDEATSALDNISRNKVLDLLMQLADERSVSYLFITHDLTVIRDVTDRAFIMKQGRFVEEGPTNQLLTSPKHAYTKALVEAAPTIHWTDPAIEAT